MLQLEMIGHIGNDAIVKEINGKPYVSLSVCHNETDKAGNKTPVWVSALWYGDGGKLFPYLVKGTQVFVRGRMRTNAYVTKDNVTKASLSVMVNEIQLCGGAKEVTEATTEPAEQPPVEAPSDEDLPF